MIVYVLVNKAGILFSPFPTLIVLSLLSRSRDLGNLGGKGCCHLNCFLSTDFYVPPLKILIHRAWGGVPGVFFLNIKTTGNTVLEGPVRDISWVSGTCSFCPDVLLFPSEVSLSCAQFFATPWTTQSMEFSRLEY